MENEFDRWNEVKKKIDIQEQNVKDIGFPQQGEVWIAILGKNIGREQNGAIDDFSRPVLVIKTFNTSMFWIVPLSTKQKHFDFNYNFNDVTGRPVSALIAQLRLVSHKRFQRKLYDMPLFDFGKICLKIRSFIP
jgi:mRNA-degrading endonuclease toxin of MazEF toxin-antitoxin module